MPPHPRLDAADGVTACNARAHSIGRMGHWVGGVLGTRKVFPSRRSARLCRRCLWGVVGVVVGGAFLHDRMDRHRPSSSSQARVDHRAEAQESWSALRAREQAASLTSVQGPSIPTPHACSTGFLAAHWVHFLPSDLGEQGGWRRRRGQMRERMCEVVVGAGRGPWGGYSRWWITCTSRVGTRWALNKGGGV
ncbi:hypothetical protein OF83DRAFT_1089007 [Amylostereum chailletii]|nr:hypothetical protein OF83DRAFT_1089007 [Amylostereum chailletii]